MGEWSNNRRRSVFYGLAGVYLLYLAYELFGNLSEMSGTEHIFCVLFTILFAIGGAGILWYAVRLFQREDKPDSEQSDEETKEKP